MSSIIACKQFIGKALELMRGHEVESRMRENFTSYLRLIFPNNPSWVNLHIECGEAAVRLQRRGKAVTGFIDNCIDSTAIEYEKDLNIKSVFDEGFRQVKEYCAAYVNAGTDPSIVLGVLSDTINWFVYEIDPSCLVNHPLTQDNIRLNLKEEFHSTTPDDNTAQNFIRFLNRHLGREGGRDVKADLFAKDFGMENSAVQSWIETLTEYVNHAILIAPEYYKMIEGMWRDYINVESSHDDTEEILDIYVHEFYISILAKLLCANLISHRALRSHDDELAEILTGKYFENKGILNFSEYDYFGWLFESPVKLIEVAHHIQDNLIVYNYTATIQEDLFGRLMVQLADKVHRLLLGQDLTPSWLAEKLVNHTISLLPQGENPQFVDMCCGSGSMIIATLNATALSCSRLSKEELKDMLLKCITGFDIDPLAVILAKTNWIIHFIQIIPDYGEVFVPIYHADSLFIQSPLSSGDSGELRLSLHTKSVVFPKSLIGSTNGDIFDAVINKCYDCIEDDIDNESLTNLLSPLIAGAEIDTNSIIKFGVNLHKALYELNAEKQNGIWSFILKNALRPSLVKACFNGIVTNTPWLALSRIPNNHYTSALRELSYKLGVRPEGSSFLHVELATVFIVSSIHRYLKDNGVFGCILPHSVLEGNNHKPFREGKYEQALEATHINVTEIWDLPKTVFNNTSVILYGYKSPRQPKISFDGYSFSSEGALLVTPFYEHHVGAMVIWSKNAEIKFDAYEHYKFLQGADIMPRSLFFFNQETNGSLTAISPISMGTEYAYFLKDMKVGKDVAISAQNIPNNFLRQVLISNVVTPFTIDKVPLALLSIKKNDIGRWEEIKSTHFGRLPRSVANVFAKVTSEYHRLKGDDKDIYKNALNCRNKLSYQNLEVGKFLVVYGAGGAKPCAAYLYINTAEVVIDQTLYWCQVDTESEALYLTALLNSNALSEHISSFQAEGQFGKRHIHTLASDCINVSKCTIQSQIPIIRDSYFEVLNSIGYVLNKMDWFNILTANLVREAFEGNLNALENIIISVEEGVVKFNKDKISSVTLSRSSYSYAAIIYDYLFAMKEMRDRLKEIIRLFKLKFQ